MISTATGRLTLERPKLMMIMREAGEKRHIVVGVLSILTGQQLTGLKKFRV